MSKAIESMSAPTHEQIAALAENIYIESGCIPGRDLENWLEAEGRLKQHQVMPPPSRAAKQNAARRIAA